LNNNLKSPTRNLVVSKTQAPNSPSPEKGSKKEDEELKIEEDVILT